MVIDCGQCAFRDVACGDCVITALAENETPGVAAGPHRNQKRNKDVSTGGRRHINGDIVTPGHLPGAIAPGGRPPGDAPRRYALGALELRGLGTLAAAGLVPPLRFRPANKAPRGIVAL